jgi:hypothetical protein
VSKARGVIGVSHHNGWAVFVTAAADGTLIDRRRVQLLDPELPVMPFHHDGQGLPPEEAIALVERVNASADRHAKRVLAEVADEVPNPILGIALRACPPLPPTIVERIRDYRAQTVADSVMYRQSLAEAAGERRWSVSWYDARKVVGAARDVLRVADIDDYFLQIRKSVGPPWQKDHRVAMAAAIVAASAGARA